MSNPTSDFIADSLGDAVEAFITNKLGIPDWSDAFPNAYQKMFDSMVYMDDRYLLQFINETLYNGKLGEH